MDADSQLRVGQFFEIGESKKDLRPKLCGFALRNQTCDHGNQVFVGANVSIGGWQFGCGGVLFEDLGSVATILKQFVYAYLLFRRNTLADQYDVEKYARAGGNHLAHIISKTHGVSRALKYRLLCTHRRIVHSNAQNVRHN